MLARFLGGVAACLGAVGALAAQQPPVAKRTAAPAVLPRSAAPAARMARPVAVSDAAPAPRFAAPAPAAAAAVLPHTPNSGLLDAGCCATSCPSYADCCTGCIPCGPPGRVWIDAAWLFGTTSGMRLPTIATTAPAGTPRAVAGTFGGPGTQTVLGGRRVNDNWRSGLWVTGGLWLDECQTCGISGDFFFLGDASSRERAASDAAGNPIITRPFFNENGRPDTELVSFPNVLRGAIAYDSSTSFIGGGPNFVKNLCCDPCRGRVDLLLGYRYLNLRDEVTIREDLTSLPGQTNVVPGTRFQVTDQFRTTNQFHGGLIGLQTERRWSHWYLNLRTSVALGVTHSVTDISGSTVITPPGGAAQTFSGGLLTQPSNIGRYTSDHFSVVPEIGVKLGAQVTENMRAYVGYNFLYWTNVTRAGDQIDLRVNRGQIPPRTGGVAGPAVPAFPNKQTDFWMQTVSLGVEFRF